MRKRRTLFARTSLTMSLSLVVFIIFSSTVVLYYLMFPIAKQAAGNLAALMVLSVQTWSELPPETRTDFEDELKNHHGLLLFKKNTTIKPVSFKTPFMLFLEKSLADRLKKEINILEDPVDDSRLWVDVSMGIHELRIGFLKHQIGPNPPIALFILVLGAAIFILVTSNLLVKRLIRPLEYLSRAAEKIGLGENFEPLKENGPDELALLAQRFNQMNRKIQELLSNRTVLLAGISHDLRTPIARITLAMEFLKNDKEEILISDIKKDLDDMNKMISQTLEIANNFNFEHNKIDTIELESFLISMISEYQRDKIQIILPLHTHCEVPAVEIALKRVLNNIIENAIRYGDGKEIIVQQECNDFEAIIRILDQGPGIPEDKREAVFQPFFRLESSRNSITGGNGLGLAIVRQICDKYDWKITFESRPGGGMIVILKLKIAIDNT